MRSKQSKHPDLYTRVTNRIVDLLEQGTLPWEPAHLALHGPPRNLVSQKPYRGINAILLGAIGFSQPLFLTYRQARELGGQVIKGEKGHLVVKYGQYRPSAREGEVQEGSLPRTRSYLRAYTVFHAPTQVEGLTIPEAPQIHPAYQPSSKQSLADRVIRAMPNPPVIREGVGSIPCYSLLRDRVDMPARESFLSEDAFYKTLFHELGHATGHETRLARPSMLHSTGIAAAREEARKTYCMEELVAEMTSAFVCSQVGILEKENDWDSAAYIGGWLKALGVQNHKRWVVHAAGQAQKASDYILVSSPGTTSPY